MVGIVQRRRIRILTAFYTECSMNKSSLIMAPMRGITTMYYRQAYVRHFQGLDGAMAPFIPTVNAERINPKLLKDVLPENNTVLPLVPQLIGNNATDFVQMCKALHDLGYEEVNWNLGCPHKPIRNKKRGSGLIAQPEMVASVLDLACSESPCRISVKVRLGVSDKTELMSLIPTLNQYPLSEVIIHARTAEQMYDGTVDIDAFELAYQALELPACYNGDIYTLADCQHISARFPNIQRFMLGRGLLANPFLCETIKSGDPGIANPIDRIGTFHEDLLERYERVLHGDHPVLGKMKEFWIYQSMHLSNGRSMFKKLKKAQTLRAYKAIVSEFLPAADWLA